MRLIKSLFCKVFGHKYKYTSRHVVVCETCLLQHTVTSERVSVWWCPSCHEFHERKSVLDWRDPMNEVATLWLWCKCQDGIWKRLPKDGPRRETCEACNWHLTAFTDEEIKAISAVERLGGLLAASKYAVALLESKVTPPCGRSR